MCLWMVGNNAYVPDKWKILNKAIEIRRCALKKYYTQPIKPIYCPGAQPKSHEAHLPCTREHRTKCAHHGRRGIAKTGEKQHVALLRSLSSHGHP